MIDIVIDILRGLTVFFFTILPILILIFIASLDIKPSILKIVRIFLCLFLPLILILVGIIVGVENFNINIFDIPAAWYYVISIIWFVMGVIFYSATE